MSFTYGQEDAIFDFFIEKYKKAYGAYNSLSAIPDIANAEIHAFREGLLTMGASSIDLEEVEDQARNVAKIVTCGRS